VTLGGSVAEVDSASRVSNVLLLTFGHTEY
jgi:hypothetical protein